MFRAVTRVAWTLALVSLACGSPTPPRSPTPAQDEETETPVRAYLLSDVSHVAPGQEFSLGVRLDIEPAWHVYWLNPGEAGLPTQVNFEAPERFRVGEARYPGPTRFEDPGGIVSYGYDELALVSAPVTAPDELTPGQKLRFSAEVSWLACREACIPGSSSNQIELEVAAVEAPSAPAHAALWTDHLARLPLSWQDLPGATSRWLAEPDHDVLELAVAAAERIEYYPSPEEQPVIAGQAAIPGSSGVTVRVSFRRGGTARPPAACRGVLRVEADKSVRYFSIDIPWPKEP
jgi:DsbC/DsbD-like thiol-disulfide interchange protein